MVEASPATLCTMGETAGLLETDARQGAGRTANEANRPSLARDTLIFWSIIAKGTKKLFRQDLGQDLGSVTTALDEQGVPLEWALVERVYANAENAYHARILDCRAKLFVAGGDDERIEREYDETFGWRKLFSKGLEIVSVPGDHLSMIREKSCRRILANRMANALRKFQASQLISLVAVFATCSG